MSRAEADPMKLIVAAVILLIAMIVILVVFRGLFSKEANVTSSNIGKVSSDTDGDGVMDYFDFCPCDPRYGKREDTPHQDKADCKSC